MGKVAWAFLVIVNALTLLALGALFVTQGAKFNAPWDGPAVVTLVLAVATLVLAAVAIGVALLAVWRYTTLREHAANVAAKAASEAADTTATRAITAWIDRLRSPEPGDGDESVADAYKGEDQ